MTAGVLSIDISKPRRTNGAWPVWIMFGLLATLVVMTGLTAVRLLHEDIHRMTKEMGAPLWSLYQLGSEHNRLQLAANNGTTAEEMKLRTEVFLGYVIRFRNAPDLAELRAAIAPHHLLTLTNAGDRLEALVSELGTAKGREKLREEVRSQTKAVREFVLAVSKLSRERLEQSNAHKMATLWLYITAIAVLFFAFIILGYLAVWFLLKSDRSDRERERQYAIQNSILASVDEAIVGIGSDGRVSYFNMHAGSMFGPDLTAGNFIPHTKGHERPLLGHLRVFVNSWRFERRPISSEVQSVVFETDKGVRHYVLRMAAAGDGSSKDDTSGSLVVTIRDVTVEVEAAQRREEYDTHMSEASRLISYAVVTGGIVHEISQPLASLRNYVHVLKISREGCAASPNFRALLNEFGLEVDRAMEVVRNVRQMGAQESSDLGHCNLSEAVKNSIRLASLGVHPPPLIRITGADMNKIEVNGSLPLTGQVIINLLRNALQSSAAAGRNGAEIHVRQSNDSVEISFNDYGHGVSEETAQRMFLPFVKSSKGGMGLGLAICQRIATNIGGTLTWKNRDEGGASFSFTLPLAHEETV